MNNLNQEEEEAAEQKMRIKGLTYKFLLLHSLSRYSRSATDL